MEEIKEVFISYHEKSAGEYVAKLADRLEGAGISCWYAKRDVSKGEDFTHEIMRQLNGCRVFLLVLNQGAVKSRYVQNELTIAFERKNQQEKIDILPCRVEDCAIGDMRLQLANAQILDAFGEPMERISALVTEVAHKLGREPAKNGLCGDGTEWRIQNGVLTISAYGDGEMGDFYHQIIPEGYNIPWWSEHEKITSVIIERDVANIGKNAFAWCGALSGVVIPDSVTSIGECAFCECGSLTSVNIPDSVTMIGERAFDSCGSLTSVNIPDSVISIGYAAFSCCSGLTSVNIPDSVAYIAPWAFASCPNLKSVSVPANAEIAKKAFDPTTKVIRRPPR